MFFNIGKNGFMKGNIPTNKKDMKIEVVLFVTFLTNRVAKKDATTGTRIKFMVRVNYSSITKATKNSKMRVSWWFIIEQFKKGFFFLVMGWVIY